MDEIRETAFPYRSGRRTYEDYTRLPEGALCQLIGEYPQECQGQPEGDWNVDTITTVERGRIGTASLGPLGK